MKRLLLSIILVPTLTCAMQPSINTQKELIDASSSPTAFRRFIGTWLTFGLMERRCAFHKKNLLPKIEVKKEEMLHHLENKRSNRTATECVSTNFKSLIHEVGKEHSINPDEYDIVRVLNKRTSSFGTQKGELLLLDSSEKMIENIFTKEEIRSQLDHEFSHTQEDAPMNIVAKDHFLNNDALLAPLPLYLYQEERTDVRGILNSQNSIKSAQGLLQTFKTIKSMFPQDQFIQYTIKKRQKTAHWVYTNLVNEQTNPDSIIF